jgi:tetratricopeptide (TPR) repeat protein
VLRRYLQRLGWLEVLTAVLVAAGVVITTTKDVLGGGVLIVVALVVTQLVPRVLGWVEQQREQDREEASLLRIRRPISEVNPFAEELVFPSALAQRDHEGGEPPYVHRDVDSTLREALKTQQFVLVTGASKAGKSRTAFEAARSMQPEPIMMVPVSPRALPKLLELGLPMNRSHPIVLWLDDLDRYLVDPGISRTLFDDLGKNGSHVAVLATMTLTAYDRFRSGEGEIDRSAREVLHLFGTEITLPTDLSPAEREEAVSLYPRQRFIAGIGEHFAAAHELIDRFKAALEVRRHGFAVAVAALDWRRAGLPRPIMEAELRELYALCLKRFHPLLEANDKDYQDGLAWAREPLESRAALLMPSTDEGIEGFEIFDYVRDWADGAGSDVDQRLRAVPESAWRFVIDRAVPAEASTIGLAAYARGNLDAAENAWTKAADSDDAPEAAVNLGLLLKEKGEYAAAEEAYRRVIDSGHPKEAPRAAVNLGLLFEEEGEYARAKEALRWAITSRHPDHAPWAAINLGRLFEEEGEYAAAEEAYQRVIDSGHPDKAPMAAGALGLLLAEQGEYGRAEEAFRRAIDSGHPNEAPWAAAALGLLFTEQGEYARAEETYQQVIDSRHPEAAPQAANNLGLLLAEQGEYGRAEEAFRRAIDSGHPEAAAAAASFLQQLRPSSPENGS